MMAVSYSDGDKVFAKIRGHPPWPARVDGIADSSPKNTKYHVFFYGTLERGICRKQDIFPYLENKERFMKLVHRKKKIKEALNQIDGIVPVPQFVPILDVKYRNGIVKRVNKSSKENNVNSCEKISDEMTGCQKETEPSIFLNNKAKHNPISLSALSNDKNPEISSTNVDLIDHQVKSPERKKSTPKQKESFKTGNKASKPSTSQSLSQLLSPGRSRSGRIIKRKTFADEVEEQPKKLKSPAVSATKTPPPQKRKDSKLQRMPIPLSCPKEKKTTMDDLLNLSNSPFANKPSALEWLATENCMTRLDTLIRGHLGMSRANTEQCIDSLDNMCNLKLKPLMLKKHPEVVETIKRLRKYVGNASAWNFSEEQRKEFEEQAFKIRTKAENLFDKFKCMFDAPDNSTFLEIFADSVLAFQKKTEEWPLAKIYALTSEPKEKKSRSKKSSQQETQLLSNENLGSPTKFPEKTASLKVSVKNSNSRVLVHKHYSTQESSEQIENQLLQKKIVPSKSRQYNKKSRKNSEKQPSKQKSMEQKSNAGNHRRRKPYVLIGEN